MNSRQFATEIVQKLQEAGYQGLWAGGCVRDELLEIPPNDYDVATDATPDQIRALFGYKRTLPIGAAFGVITVLGPKKVAPIDVATFRRDSVYSDGRRPDSVAFTDAVEDARRRDFTINGMFFDPIQEEVLDYVGGQNDLSRGVVRAIGNPHERIDEDKLRMLRGVRFAATYDFQLDPETLRAIRDHAAEISVVSEERIGAELRRMLGHVHRARAADLLKSTGLLDAITPSSWPAWDRVVGSADERSRWNDVLERLERLRGDSFEGGAVLLLHDWCDARGADPKTFASELQRAWRLTNAERDTMAWVMRHGQTLTQAEQKPWSVIQPLLIDARAPIGLDVAEAMWGPCPGIDFCWERLGWEAKRLNPPPLLLGRDLIEMGIRPGPDFKKWLQQIRDDQLDGKLDSVEAARAWVEAMLVE